MSSILQEAEAIVGGDRKSDYGDVRESHRRIGKLWSCILPVTREITPEEVALAMILMKVSREVNRPKRDNRVDMAGYALCLDQISRTIPRLDPDSRVATYEPKP